MKKLLVALIAAAFTAGAYAQTTPAPKSDPAAPATKAEKSEKKAKAKGEKKAKSTKSSTTKSSTSKSKSDAKSGGMDKKAATPAPEKKDSK